MVLIEKPAPPYSDTQQLALVLLIAVPGLTILTLLLLAKGMRVAMQAGLVAKDSALLPVYRELFCRVHSHLVPRGSLFINADGLGLAQLPNSPQPAASASGGGGGHRRLTTPLPDSLPQPPPASAYAAGSGSVELPELPAVPEFDSAALVAAAAAARAPASDAPAPPPHVRIHYNP
jgi:hypothetical protein